MVHRGLTSTAFGSASLSCSFMRINLRSAFVEMICGVSPFLLSGGVILGQARQGVALGSAHYCPRDQANGPACKISALPRQFGVPEPKAHH
jgi:hypothetical protein